MTSNKLIFIWLLITAANAFAKVEDVGIYGASYDILEKDAILELQKASEGIAIQDLFSREEMRKKVMDFRPDTTLLPKTTQDREFLVDMSYTLEFDIPDQYGHILYPKGYTFNPLAYYTNRKIYVVIDGEDREQITWFKRSPYFNQLNVSLMITRGSYTDLTEELDRPVFYALKTVTERFRLEHAPSVVFQEGTYMRVKEIVCTEKKQSSN